MLTTEQIAHEWIDAFNNRDLNRLVGLYAEDAEHFSPETEGTQTRNKRTG